MLVGHDMVKYSVCVIPHNDEPSMRARRESMAGWGEELVVADFSAPIEGIGVYRCGIKTPDGYGVRSVLQSATSKVEAVRGGVILTSDARTCVGGACNVSLSGLS